jgi:hypothetical protein
MKHLSLFIVMLGIIYAVLCTGWIFGDPHIKTLDGLAYDYNGVGEYWPIKSPVLQVQACTSQATDAVSDVPGNASIYTAFTIQLPETVGPHLSDHVVAMLTSNTCKLLVV